MPEIKRWSFSQWETYNSCPARWKYASIDKLPRKPPGPAASRGLEMHATVEEYIKGADAHVLHKAIHPKFIPILDEFRNHPNGDRYTEKRLGLDEEWYVTGPTDKNTFCIAILDAARYTKPDAETPGVLHIGEWKSGKPKDTHGDQRKLYATVGWKAWLADEVHVTTYYLEDTEAPQRLTLKSESGYEKLKTMWMSRIETMKRDELCAPRPGYHCNWCDFSKKEGGPCQFGG